MGKRRTSLKNVDKNDDVCPMDIDCDASASLSKVIKSPMKKTRKACIPKALKMKVWEKTYSMDVGQAKCLNCKLTTISQMNFHCSHIIPESAGGLTNLDNLVALCAVCNTSMGKRNMIEFHNQYFK